MLLIQQASAYLQIKSTTLPISYPARNRSIVEAFASLTQLAQVLLTSVLLHTLLVVVHSRGIAHLHGAAASAEPKAPKIKLLAAEYSNLTSGHAFAETTAVSETATRTEMSLMVPKKPNRPKNESACVEAEKTPQYWRILPI